MRQKQRVETRQATGQTLAGRLEAARWLSYSEPRMAREIAAIESDPLFRELLYAPGGPLRRKRWPASSLHAGFYELDERTAAGSGSADVSDLLEKKGGLLELIRRIGRERFEKYFLYAEARKPLPELCRELGVSEAEARNVLDLVLEVGARSEFFVPPTAAREAGAAYHCIARIEQDARDPQAFYFLFTTPQWARGRYLIERERLEAWKKQRRLSPQESRRLKKLLGRIESVNMRQDALFQILTRAVEAQTAYLRTRDLARRRPLSLREMARRIGVAPSTVSRAAGNRSVELPWGEEVALKSLLSGQRQVLESILGAWKDAGSLEGSDEALARRLARENGISVSRRTINDVRRSLKD